jgi:hypothetical protein
MTNDSLTSGQFAGAINDIAIRAGCTRDEAQAAIALTWADDGERSELLRLLKGSGITAGVRRALISMREMTEDAMATAEEGDES